MDEARTVRAPDSRRRRAERGKMADLIDSKHRGEPVTTTTGAAARRVTYQLETLWDYDYVPTHEELATLYETAKQNQCNGSAAIDWERAASTEAPVLHVQMAPRGTTSLTERTPR